MSTLSARQQPALAEPGTSNLCFRSREEMSSVKKPSPFTEGSVSVRLSPSVAVTMVVMMVTAKVVMMVMVMVVVMVLMVAI